MTDNNVLKWGVELYVLKVGLVNFTWVQHVGAATSFESKKKKEIVLLRPSEDRLLM